MELRWRSNTDMVFPGTVVSQQYKSKQGLRFRTWESENGILAREETEAASAAYFSCFSAQKKSTACIESQIIPILAWNKHFQASFSLRFTIIHALDKTEVWFCYSICQGWWPHITSQTHIRWLQVNKLIIETLFRFSCKQNKSVLSTQTQISYCR